MNQHEYDQLTWMSRHLLEENRILEPATHRLRDADVRPLSVDEILEFREALRNTSVYIGMLRDQLSLCVPVVPKKKFCHFWK